MNASSPQAAVLAVLRSAELHPDAALVALSAQLARAVSFAYHESPRRMEPWQAALAILRCNEVLQDDALPSEYEDLAERIARAAIGVLRPDSAHEERLRVAQTLLERFKGLKSCCTVSHARDPVAFDRYCAGLREKITRLQEELGDYYVSRTLLLALDATLPGWVDIDASDYLPAGTPQFVSNRPDEWYAWLCGHGLHADGAEQLVAAHFEDWTGPGRTP